MPSSDSPFDVPSDSAIRSANNIPEKAKVGRVVTVVVPSGPHVNSNMRLYISESALWLANRKDIKVSIAGRVMPRNDILNIEPEKILNPGRS